jgi:polysaccharide biosynthesis protein PslG
MILSIGVGLAASVTFPGAGQAALLPDIPWAAGQLVAMPGVGAGGALNGTRPSPGVSAHLLSYSDYLVTQTGTTPEADQTREAALRIRREDLALMKAAGFEFVRTDFRWDLIEKVKGTYDFGTTDRVQDFDRAVTDVTEQGMSALFVMCCNNRPYSDGGAGLALSGIASDSNREGFVNWAKQSAAHYTGRNVVFEVWNEPDLEFFWRPTPNATDFAQLANETVAGMRSVDSDVRVVTGGISAYQTAPYIDTAIAAGLIRSNPTGVGLHTYRPSPESLLGLGSESDPNYENVARTRERLGSTIDIYSTEDGYSAQGDSYYHPAWRQNWHGYEGATNGDSDKGRQQQAVLNMRLFLAAWEVGLKSFTFYDLRNDGTDPTNREHTMGLLDQRGQPKPAYYGLKNLFAFTDGLTMTGTLRDKTHYVNLVRFGNDKYVAWFESLNYSRTYEIPLQAKATRLRDNTPVATEPCGNGLCLTLSGFEGPIGIETLASVAPTTLAPTTLAPTTLAPTTLAPTTLAPTVVVFEEPQGQQATPVAPAPAASLSSLTVTLFLDTDLDGRPDSSDNVPSDLLVELVDKNGSVTTATLDQQGRAHFERLVGGPYTVRVKVPGNPRGAIVLGVVFVSGEGESQASFAIRPEPEVTSAIAFTGISGITHLVVLTGMALLVSGSTAVSFSRHRRRHRR